MRKYLMLLCTTLLSIQGAYAMDLNEALTSAYNTNESLKAAQQKFLGEAEKFPQALASFLPDVSMSIASSSSKSTEVGGAPPNTNESGPDLSRGIQVSQNIFKGGQDAYGIKIAQAAFMQSKSAFYSTEQKILTDAIAAYLDLCSAKEQYNIAIAAGESAQQNLDMVREKLKVGESTVTEVAAAEANFAKAQSQISQQYAGLVGAKASFRVLIGVEATDDVAFPEPRINNMPQSLDAFKAMAEKSNFDIVAAKSSAAQSKDGVKQAYGALLPTATLRVSEGRNSQAQNNRSPARKTRSVNTEVSVSIPILSNGGVVHSKIRAVKAQSRQSVYNLDYVRKQINSFSISNWETVHSLKDVIKSNDEAVRAQSVALEGVKSEYAVGMKTILEVLTQQDQLNQLKGQAVDARNKYLKADYQLQALIGQLTAKQLKLKVKYFDPDYEFRNVKHKMVGF